MVDQHELDQHEFHAISLKYIREDNCQTLPDYLQRQPRKNAMHTPSNVPSAKRPTNTNESLSITLPIQPATVLQPGAAIFLVLKRVITGPVLVLLTEFSAKLAREAEKSKRAHTVAEIVPTKDSDAHVHRSAV